MAELRTALAPRLQVLRSLGVGGMGCVFLARDPALKRMVAVKVLTPSLASDSTAHERFVREAEAVAMVSHPNIVGVYQVGELPGLGIPYFVMQFVEGATLDQEFPPGIPVPEARAKKVFGEVASALAIAHARGLVHRDIKPRNIMLDRESGRAVVLDFGISAALRQPQVVGTARLTSAGTYIGTPMYMSPEQACGEEVGDRSDVYSLGVVGYEMLTGKPPFRGGSSIELMAAHLRDTAPSVHSLRPDVGEQFASLVDRCLTKAPAGRPAAAEIADFILPSAQRHIEWPPPGLERLHGLGIRFLSALGFAAVVGLLFFVLLSLQPTFSSPRWHEGEQSEFWAALSSPGRVLEEASSRGLEDRSTQAVDASPIWFFLLGLSLVAIVTALPVVARRSWTLADRMLWGRKSGYPWSVLVDVAWDHDPDMPQLLNRTGSYALLPASDRARLLKLRRIEEILVTGTHLLAVLGPVMWLAGLTGGWSRSTTSVVPLSEAMLVIAPAVIGMMAVFWSRQLQSKILGQIRPRRRFWRIWDKPLIRPELVAAWLGSVGRNRPKRPRFVPAAGLSILATMFAAAILGCAAVAMLVTFVVRGRLAPTRARAVAWLQSVESDTLRPLRWQRVDSILAYSARATNIRSQPDTLNASRLLLRARFSGSIDSVWDAGPPRMGEQWPEDTTIVDVDHITQVFEQLPGRLKPEDMDELRRDTLSHWLGVWRAIASSAPLPPLWGYRKDFPGVTSPLEIPSRALAIGAQELASRNRAAAALAQALGDKERALARARENIAVARQLMRSPVLIDLVTGTLIAMRGASMLGEIGRITDDRELKDEAQLLNETLRRFRSESYLSLSSFLALMADPEEPIGIRHLADTSLPTPVRSGLVTAIVTGYCVNAREVLFGIDPRRRAALERAGEVMRDIPRAGEIIQLHRRWLEQLIEDPSDALASYDATTPGGLKPFGWIGLDDLKARLGFCSQPF
ncbi:MAG: serine/threonine-protein kinase [Gemmatimonadaceae bacterium]